MDFLIGLSKIVFGFTLIIGIHELGHAIASMLCGVKIRRFSIGMGPGWTIRNVPKFTELKISPIVIGGYVELDEQALAEKSFWKRFFVMISGMLFNVLMAITLLVVMGANVFKAIYVSFYLWFAGIPMTISILASGQASLSEAVAGPIGIGPIMVSDAIPYIYTLAMINLALAMFNLIPLPPLDGGRIFIDITSKIFGKNIGAFVGRILMAAGIVLLITLLLYATGNDISRLFK